MSENTASAVYPKLTDGVSFSNWKFRVKLLLEEKGLVHALKDGSEKKITAEEDAKARSTIVHCLTDRNLELVKKCASAAEMIVQLEKIFERKSVFNRLHLRKQLLSMRFVTTEKMDDHLLRFDTLIDKLEATGSKMEEGDKVCHLLLSLPSEYDTLITALETLSNEKELTMDFVKSRLLDEELKKKGRRSETEPEASFLSCYNCGKTGHKSYQCTAARSGGRQTNNMRTTSRGRTGGRSFRGNHRGYTRNYTNTNNLVRGSNKDDDTMFVTAEECSQTESKDVDNINLIIDSGATHHFIEQRFEKQMMQVKDLETPILITIANGEGLVARKTGILRVFHKNNPIRIECLIVPGLKHNLLSVNKLMERNIKIIFDKGLKIITNDKTFYGEKIGKLFILKVTLMPNQVCYPCQSDSQQDTDIWHRRFGHLNRKGLSILNLPFKNQVCETCMKNKSTRLPFKSIEYRQSTGIGDLIHSDVAGPARVPTKEGFRFYQTIMDDHSHFTQTYLMQNKSEAAENLIKYIEAMERERGIKVKRIRCDNGGEYTSLNFKRYCERKGISIEYTLPYSPQMNGKSERMNRTIYEKARTILDESNLPRHLWGQAVLTATYLINRCPSRAINNEIPAQIFGREFKIDKLRVFGCKGWMVVLPRGDKFDQRAIEVRMIGYAKNGYKVWDPKTEDIKVTRDVRFNEEQIPYSEDMKQNNENCIEKETYIYEENNTEEKEEKLSEEKEKKANQENRQDTNNTEDKRNEAPNENESETRTPRITTRKGREVKLPNYLNDYELHEAFCLVNIDEEPKDYDEAIKTGWKQAIENEVNALKKMNTWSETELPKNKKAIDAKWVFKIKENGIKKARLVAKGFQIKEPEDFGKNYAPVARTSTVRTLMAHAVQNNLPMRQLDVPTAFLNGKLESEIYVKPPEGIEVEEGKVLKLNRGLYGLKESPKVWNERINDFMKEKGFKRSLHDFCLYTKENVWIVLYVDDMIITGLDTKIKTILTDLKNEFHVKDMGQPKLFLGMEMERNEDSLKITQKRQIDKMLQKFGMNDCKGTSTPMTKGYQLDRNEECLTSENIPYRQLVGSLLYVATICRPDIAYCTAYLSQYLDKPTISLWIQGKRVLRYLKTTSEQGLIYNHDEDYTEIDIIETYSDADWAGDCQDRKSVSGSASFYNGHLVSWFSRKQPCVALSTVEAEYVAAAASACELVYLRGLQSDFSGTQKGVQCFLYMDNKGAIQLAQSYENSKRTKHIDIKTHYLKDLLMQKVINISYVPTDKNLADLFTKNLSSDKMVFIKGELNIV